jgi:hypothetical protein
MDSAHDFFDKPTDKFMTPDSLAWDLVMGDGIDDFGGIMESLVTDGDGSRGVDRLQKLADEFQILITIYFEMVFNVLKSNYMSELLTEDGELKDGIDLESELDSYSPDFRKYSIQEMTDIFKEKFSKIRYFMHVQDITEFCDPEDPTDFGLDNEYYCRILLLDDKRGATDKYFRKARHIPPNKRYTFLLREDNDPDQNILGDFYAVVYLPRYKNPNDPTDSTPEGRKFKLSFSNYNVIVKE